MNIKRENKVVKLKIIFGALQTVFWGKTPKFDQKRHFC